MRASYTRWTWLLGCAVALLSCRPAERELLLRALPQPPSAAAKAVGADSAPALSIRAQLELDSYVRDLLDSFALKRADRLGAALEPGEGPEETYPHLHSMRLKKDIDPIEAHFNAGEELFEAELTLLRGFGTAMGGTPPNFHRVHRGAHGGPDSTSCRGCHHRGGDDGAGEYNEAALIAGDGRDTFHANERNPPPLGGGGLVQILAREISQTLATQAQPIPQSQSYEVKLSYQNVDFGSITISPDGRTDSSRLTAIDSDLVVRPFGWKGTHSTLRRFAEEAFQVHHGLQSEALVARRSHFGMPPMGSSPATHAVAAALGPGSPSDPDGDHREQELVGGQLTAISVYLSLLPMPIIDPPRAPDLLAAWRQGYTTFRAVGCESCHKSMWTIRDPRWTERGEDASSPLALELDMRRDIRNGPPLQNLDTALYEYPVFLFSDLRRHDMGAELADAPIPKSTQSAAPVAAGGPAAAMPIPPSFFLTRPLWGLADSGPYLHDGRAVTLHEAIIAHGGEASAVRDAYRKLAAGQQRALQVFLFSLARQALPEVSR